MMEAPTPAEQSALDKIQGLDATPVTEMLSMASSSTSLDPLLVALKAVDPAKYPFYGDVVLEPAIPIARGADGFDALRLATICCCVFI